MSPRIILLAAASLLVASTPAGAQGESAVVIEHVSIAYGDLDLSTHQGADEMLARLRGAATRACIDHATPDQDHLAVAIEQQGSACRKAAIEQALAQLDRPLVTLAYRGGQRP